MMNSESSIKARRFNLEERLIDYSVLITEIVETMPNTRAGNHYAGQLIRSGTSPALNYAEAQSGESRKDFIHKLKIVLKELRETTVCLRIINRTNLFKSKESIQQAINESNELISIFVKSKRQLKTICKVHFGIPKSVFGVRCYFSRTPNKEHRIMNNEDCSIN